MITEAQKKAQARYDKKNCRMISFKFNLETDKDILDQLDSKDNKQGYVKELIRKDIGADSANACSKRTSIFRDSF